MQHSHWIREVSFNCLSVVATHVHMLVDASRQLKKQSRGMHLLQLIVNYQLGRKMCHCRKLKSDTLQFLSSDGPLRLGRCEISSELCGESSPSENVGHTEQNAAQTSPPQKNLHDLTDNIFLIR